MSWQEIAHQAAAEERARYNRRYTEPPKALRGPAWDNDSPACTAARRRVLVRDFRPQTAELIP